MAVRALLIGLLCLVTVPTFAANCVHPDVEQFLEQSREVIDTQAAYFPSPTGKFLPFTAEGQQLQWLGAGWEAPYDGALFVLDCTGNRIAALAFGYVKELRAGPLVPSFGQTFEVIYISESGTGLLEESIALVAFKNNVIATLWDHQASNEISAPSEKIEYNDRFSWRFAEGGARIEVSGERELGEFKDAEHGWEPNTKHALPSESFCWDATEKKFQGCK